jgi:hypothetical protein
MKAIEVSSRELVVLFTRINGVVKVRSTIWGRALEAFREASGCAVKQKR